MVWLYEKAFEKTGIYWWVAPVYAQAKLVYRRMKKAIPADLFVANESEMTISLLNGSVIFFKSAEKPDNLYGEDVMAAVLDEASRMREEAFIAVRSTLTATRGMIRIIGNVKGTKNWFFKIARLAAGGERGYHYSKLTAYDAVGPFRMPDGKGGWKMGSVVSLQEIEDAKRDLAPFPGAFEELYLAEPTEDGSNPFDVRAIAECTVNVPLLDAYGTYDFKGADIYGPARSWGWDFARGKQAGSDWTVGIGLNAQREVCGFDRFQGPWDQQYLRIRSNTGNTEALCDSTGLGDAVVEELQKGGGNYEGYKFTMQSKQVLMEDLAIKIQQRAIRIPAGIIVEELTIFEYVYTRTGVRYSAPEGMHDDTVMALALANHHLGSGFVGGLRGWA